MTDKLDNNRSVALSNNIELKEKARQKTLNTVIPVVKKYYPEYLKKFDNDLQVVRV